MPLSLTSTSTEFITLDEVKAFANIPLSQTAHDFELDMIRSAAQEAVEDRVGPVLHRAITETLNVHGRSVLLSTSPVLSITSVDSSGTPITGTAHTAWGLLSDVYSYGPVTVTYVAGRASCPESLRLAALIIAEHLWQTQRSGTPSALPQQQDIDVPIGLGYAIPARAVDLMQPYLVAPGIA